MGGKFQMKLKISLILILVTIMLLPEIIKLMRLKHMNLLGYKYEGDELVRI